MYADKEIYYPILLIRVRGPSCRFDYFTKLVFFRLIGDSKCKMNLIEIAAF